MHEPNATLILENGRSFPGKSFGHPQPVTGEVVFNTAMTAYPESLTDPSYYGQILVATYPLIGNYGIPEPGLQKGLISGFESEDIHIQGLVITDYSEKFSHWNARESLGQWLNRYHIPAIHGVDTRAVTKVLREQGSMQGKIVIANRDIEWPKPEMAPLIEHVSTKEIRTYGDGNCRILLVDCGVKYNIIRSLLNYDTTIQCVPWDYDYTGLQYDGLVISNGPGDPALCGTAIAHLKNALQQQVPVFGICLGSQLMALAAGARTYKLKYGHRSHNQPVICHDDNRCYITSQNHGYAVEINSLDENWIPYLSNLNDQSCEGIRHRHKPFFATQFHPEASGGPTDTAFLFDRFMNEVIKYKS
ncbi:MAG: glutamine-hydrolyzing carbamoyl-phosphate synthase small subunit [Bacteroidales bacterium]